MAKPLLLLPEAVRNAVARRYRRGRQDWLVGEGEWPLDLVLGSPDEREAQRQPDAVHAWIAAWEAWSGEGELVWRERRWHALGAQRMPERLLLHGPASAAAWLGEGQRWQRASSRHRLLTAWWPALSARLSRHFDLLAGWDAAEIQRLEDLLAWLQANPQSHLYARQLPIAGVDSKWLEGRMTVIADLLAALKTAAGDESDFYRLCGLKPPPHTVRLFILDKKLRERTAGLRDISARPEELAALDLPASRIYIVENQQTGLAFEDHPGSVVFMGLGYGASILASLPWVVRAKCTYWGDLDTHGFAILSRARLNLPHLESALMDEHTLLCHRGLWVTESPQYAAPELPFLTPAEQALYCGLKQQRWDVNVRLEQERIAWNYAWSTLAT